MMSLIVRGGKYWGRLEVFHKLVKGAFPVKCIRWNGSRCPNVANGKPRFIAGVVDAFNITQIINDALTSTRVRWEMKQEEATVIGPGGVKMTQPTLMAILGIFNFVPYNRIIHKKDVVRKLLRPLIDSQLKILRYLGLSLTLLTETS